MPWTAGTRLLLWAVCLPPPAATIAQLEKPAPPSSPEEIRRRLAEAPRVVRSPSRRVLVTARHAGDAMAVVDWASDVLERAEKAVGADAPFTPEAPLRIRILPPRDGDTNAAARVKVAGGALILHRGPTVDADRANEGLCRLILRAYVRDSVRGGPDGAAGDAAARGEAPAPVPRWLSLGLARNLFPVTRARDTQRALAMWDRGQLPPVAELVRKRDVKVGGRDAAARCGLWVGWLLERKAHAETFRALFRALSRGRVPAMEWWLETHSEWSTPAEMEMDWDLWVLSRNRMIYNPGTTTQRDARRFRAGLLLYPGVFGMPMVDEPYRPVPWERLIAWREASWIDRFSAKKSRQLRVLTFGKGPSLRSRAEAYCRFLKALREGRDKRVLAARLKAARDLDDSRPERTGDREE